MGRRLSGLGMCLKGRRPIVAEHRLEAYATLRFRLADRGPASFKNLSEQ